MIEERVTDAVLNGRAIKEYTITRGDIKVAFLNYGGVIKNIFIKDKRGNLIDVALGFDNPFDYFENRGNFGAIVGRYANRIINAEFELGGKKYRLQKNDREHHLHGSFIRSFFDSRIEGDSLVLTRVSAPEEEGFPGTLSLTVTYSLTEENGVRIEYEAFCDEDTPLNLTNHTYFNLAGQWGERVTETVLTMKADRFTPVTSERIPTGEILPVDNTLLDFRAGRRLGDGLSSDSPEITVVKGYDHNLILEKGEGERLVGSAYSEESGISMDIYTTEPACQLYVRNTMGFGKEEREGKNPLCSGFCLETQHYPASPNFPHFPSSILKNGERFYSVTEYRFKRK